MLKREADNDFSFDVITINCKNPPKEFKEISKKLPTLVHGDVVLNDVDEIEDYLDSLFSELKLAVKDPEAFRVQSNVFTRFTYLIKDVTNNPQPLIDELEKIDKFLQQRRTKYIGGEAITGEIDHCSLLTASSWKHQVSIVLSGRNYNTFAWPWITFDVSPFPRNSLPCGVISVEFSSIDSIERNEWLSDLGSAYALDAFVKSCPSDQEIVLHWIRRETSPKEYLQLTKEEPKYSLSVPESR